MSRLTHHEVTTMFLALGVLITLARIMAELARRFRQPAILGELLVGILIGPSLLGRIAPEWVGAVFPTEGPNALVLNGLTTLSIALFLLLAGMEVDLSIVWRQGKTAVAVSVGGIVVPFAVGFAAGWFVPHWLSPGPRADHLTFALFFATALSISALPVIARTLMDLHLYKTDLGMIVVAAAVCDDLVGWIIFAIILGMIGASGVHGMGVGYTVAFVLGFAAFVLTVGRWFVNRALLWLQAYADWPGAALAFALSLAMFSAAFTEWCGIHAIFGAFLIGVAIGDSPHLREKIRANVHQFVSFIFAPIFFTSIGLRVDFVSNFSLSLVLIVLVIACAGKVLGCTLAGRLAGMETRESWAVGFAMNSRGAMEIILGMLALQAGLINDRMFVALVVMALATSIMGGPAMQAILKRRKVLQLTDLLSAKTFVADLKAKTRRQAVTMLSRSAAAAANLDPDAVDKAVWKREKLMSTGLGNGLAIPHARMAGAAAPVISIGLSREGVDFDAADGLPARVVFLILTPETDSGAQVEVLAEIARTFSNAEVRERAAGATSYTEFIAALRAK